MTTIYWTSLSSPIGSLLLAATESGLCSIEFGDSDVQWSALRQWCSQHWGDLRFVEAPERLGPASEQLTEYFQGRRERFALPLDLQGTPFQLKVWQALEQIPYGTVVSYRDIAERTGNSRAVRAVGGANNRNPVPLVIPCHRVVGANGHLTGYGGGMDIKTFLLELEGHSFQQRDKLVIGV